MAEDSLVTVATYVDAIQAHLAKTRLESEGIVAFVANENLIWANWMLSNAAGGVGIQVPSAQAEEARRILEEIDSRTLEISPEEVACPRCGSTDTHEKKTSWRIAFLVFFLLRIPLPFRRGELRCSRCGYKWRPDSNQGIEEGTT